jgi:hypothetical protein
MHEYIGNHYSFRDSWRSRDIAVPAMIGKGDMYSTCDIFRQVADTSSSLDAIHEHIFHLIFSPFLCNDSLQATVTRIAR